MFKVGYGVQPFKKKPKTKKDMMDILQHLEEGKTIRIQQLPAERTCMVTLRGVPCGNKYIPTRADQKSCSPWCQNRAATQKLRAKRAKNGS